MKQDVHVAGYPAHPVRLEEPNTQADDEISIDLREIWQKIWEGKWIIAISIVMAGVIAFLLISQMVPQYRASAKVMFDLTQRNIVNVDQVVVSSDINEDTIQNEIEILRSTAVIDEVITKLNLDRNPEFNPALATGPETFRDRIGSWLTLPPDLADFLSGIGVLAPPAPPQDPVEAAERQRRSVIQNVLNRLSLRPVRGSKVMEISFTSTNPRTAALVVNTVAEQYIVDQLDSKLEATRQATDWLSGRVEELRDRVQNAEEAVELARAELSLEAGQSLEITQQQLTALSAALSVARNNANAAEAVWNRLNTAIEEGRDFGTITEFRGSGLIQEYRELETELMSREITVRGSVPEGHPVLERLNTQLEEVRRNIRIEAERIAQAAKTDWESALEQQASLEAEVRDLENKALRQSREQVAIRQLEREAQASRVLYENFLGRLKETSEQEELQSADARILSPAEPPLFAESQAKKRTLLLALILGGMAGVGIVFLLDKLNNTFRSPHQLEKLTGESVLGTLPTAGSKMRRSEVIKVLRERPKSSLAESVRSLRTSLLFSNVDRPPRSVMFTSSVPREGKSTTSMLVALTSRQMGKTAIIVDCDLRLPALARLLGADDERPGLLSLIEGAATLEEAVFRDPDTGLHVLMTKPSEPRSNINPADILSSNRFRDLIDDLKSRYDLVILDTPPTLVVADSRILASQVDAVVYTVRWDHTPRGAVIEGLKELRAVNAPIAGVVLTLVNEAKAAKYSYDGYSYYKGRYTDYYVS